MEKIDLPFFYELGAKVSAIIEMKPENTSGWSAWLAMAETNALLEKLLNSFPTLTVCRKGASQVIKAMESLNETLGKEKNLKFDGPLPQQFHYKTHEVVNAAREFQTVLSAELQTLATYHATQKGIYSTPDLIERADHIFPESIRQKLGDHVIEEIRQSGRCLAFDNATACGFHMMRATEAVMHEYYVAVCQPQAQDKLDNWGAYLAKLRGIKQPDVEKVVAILQQLKDQDRNLIMHPEVVLSAEEAFVLFEVAQGAIIAMASRL